MANRPKILAFAGSLRRDSYNKKCVQVAAKGAEKAGADVTYIDLRDFPMPIYDQEIEDAEGLPEEALEFKQLLMDHQGLLISSPEYNSGYSAALKNAIDWASRPADKNESSLACFVGKVAGLVAASPGGLGGLRGLFQLRSVLLNIQVIVLPKQTTVASCSNAFDDDGNLVDLKKQAAVEAVGAEVASFLAKLQNS